MIVKQLSQRFLRDQGTTLADLKASTTSIESVSNHNFFQPFCTATSMANIAPTNSVFREEEIHKLKA
jgi:hypothetical protein